MEARIEFSAVAFDLCLGQSLSLYIDDLYANIWLLCVSKKKFSIALPSLEKLHWNLYCCHVFSDRRISIYLLGGSQLHTFFCVSCLNLEPESRKLEFDSNRSGARYLYRSRSHLAARFSAAGCSSSIICSLMSVTA